MSGVASLVVIPWSGAWPVTVAIPGGEWDAQGVEIMIGGKPAAGVDGVVAAVLLADGALAPTDAAGGASAAFDAAVLASGWLPGEQAPVSVSIGVRAIASGAAPARGALTADAAQGRAIWRTSDGDAADAIARAVYGSENGGATERLLDANPGLADIGPVLPADLYLALPPAPVVAVRRVRRLWS